MCILMECICVCGPNYFWIIPMSIVYTFQMTMKYSLIVLLTSTSSIITADTITRHMHFKVEISSQERI